MRGNQTPRAVAAFDRRHACLCMRLSVYECVCVYAHMYAHVNGCRACENFRSNAFCSGANKHTDRLLV